MKWTLAETAAYSGRGLSSTDDSTAVFNLRSLEHRYREAEGQALVGDVDPLQMIRTQISRGQTCEAANAIHGALKSELADKSEYLFELARIHLLHGEWQLCIDRMTDVLAGPLAQVTRMTALQCRSVASYELGLWSAALRDIEHVLAISLLFPLAPAGFYASALKIKIKALQAQSFDRLLESLWGQAIGEPNLDRWLTLCRLEADLARIGAGGGLARTRRWSIAAHSIAIEMGDELYAALARFELWASGDRSPELVSERAQDLSAHPRVAMLNLALANPVATTSKLFGISSNESIAFADRPAIEAILFPSRGLVLRLAPLAIINDPKSKKMIQLLSALREPLTKAELFRALHGDAKYAPHLHDATLHQLISRTRRRTGLKIEIENGRISAPGLWCV